MRRFLLLAVPFVALLFAAQARADTITYQISFTATGQVPASGTFQLTFDPTLTYSNTSAGFTVLSLTGLSSDSTVGFSYSPVNGGSVEIGGLATGVNGVHNGTSDFILGIANLNGSPQLVDVAITSPRISTFAEDSSGTVTATPLLAATPEPSSLALLGTGVLGVAGVVRRRFA